MVAELAVEAVAAASGSELRRPPRFLNMRFKATPGVSHPAVMSIRQRQAQPPSKHGHIQVRAFLRDSELIIMLLSFLTHPEKMLTLMQGNRRFTVFRTIPLRLPCGISFDWWDSPMSYPWHIRVVARLSTHGMGSLTQMLCTSCMCTT